ncbi:MAG: sugar phosphate nucleotidyltransferase [Janthinobacterium lividum]
MWGIIPAAGAGSRIQPLAFSKELLPVGSQIDNGVERPRAVSEYLVERMIRGGADKLCFVISPGKTDILQYYGSRLWGADIAYVVQPSPGGLCDALFRAAALVRPDEAVLIGLPDTVWSPADALARMPDDRLSFLTFPVEHPEYFDAVVADADNNVLRIDVKQQRTASHWIWGAVKMPGHTFHELRALWCGPDRRDEYLGTLVNAWLGAGGTALNVPIGEEYVDTGTLHGYRAAIRLLEGRAQEGMLLKTEKTEAQPAAAQENKNASR